MTVVYKGPGCAPEVREIGNTLRDLQACVCKTEFQLIQDG